MTKFWVGWSITFLIYSLLYLTVIGTAIPAVHIFVVVVHATVLTGYYVVWKRNKNRGYS